MTTTTTTASADTSSQVPIPEVAPASAEPAHTQPLLTPTEAATTFGPGVRGVFGAGVGALAGVLAMGTTAPAAAVLAAATPVGAVIVLATVGVLVGAAMAVIAARLLSPVVKAVAVAAEFVSTPTTAVGAMAGVAATVAAAALGHLALPAALPLILGGLIFGALGGFFLHKASWGQRTAFVAFALAGAAAAAFSIYHDGLDGSRDGRESDPSAMSVWPPAAGVATRRLGPPARQEGLPR